MDIQEFKKSRSDRWLLGVCGGLGRFTQIPSIIWRCIFIFSGIGFLPYIILFFVMGLPDD
jgi:phage shock protein PspC (stress-responsive transcriptional regulator)